MQTLLIVDDEPNLLYSLSQGLQTEQLRVLTVATGREGVEAVREHRPDAVILDVRLPDQSGLDAFEAMRRLEPRLPVIIFTAHATTETAIEAMKRGAFEYLVKPVDFAQLEEVVHNALTQSRQSRVPAVFDASGDERDGADYIVGQAPAMQEVYKAIGRVAPLDMTVLILGASGTGKELVARAIFQHSRRSEGPFLAINCAALPETLLESELFGHERGAFTGADRQRIGKFEQAHRGTVFLDEIGDTSLATQAKMLRLLQEQRFERVGGRQTIQTDVRVLAATNHPLEDLVAAGRFRLDLYYRLNTFTIRLPTLRERKQDLPLLVQHFLRSFGRDLGRHVASVSPEAMRILEAHSWPGNVRELQSTIKYAMVHATGDTITPHCLPDNLRSSGGAAAPAGAAPFDVADMVRTMLLMGEADLYRKVGSAVDRVVLDLVLRHVRGSQNQASELLGISRNTLRAKLRALGLAVEKQVLADSDQEDQELTRP